MRLRLGAGRRKQKLAPHAWPQTNSGQARLGRSQAWAQKHRKKERKKGENRMKLSRASPAYMPCKSIEAN
jgi:hypothetical protein